MFGIILGTHGEFANGILESCKMILGENLVSQGVRAVTLKQGEGTESVIAKYNAASIIAVAEENYGIVSGVNLPMLVAMIQEQMADDGADIKVIMTKAVEAGYEGLNSTSYDELNAPPAEDEDEL